MKCRHVCGAIGWYLGFLSALTGCGGGLGSGESGFTSYQSPLFDGSGPSGLIRGSDGNFYGTTTFGGKFQKGTLFRITPEGEETVVYAFAGGSDGAYPSPGLVQGAGNSFYGTTYEGGVGVCPRATATLTGGAVQPASTCGTVFTVTPDGAETVLYYFRGLADGGQPTGALVQSGGNFYGTTNYGGVTSAGCGSSGCGTVFRITPAGAETVLFAFTGGLNDESLLPSSLVEGNDGDFYGVTNVGGTNNDGTVFKVTPAGVETVLHSFTGCVNGSTDGCQPATALIQGSDGNFYGTTAFGGSGSDGTVFKITPSGVETVLYSFTGDTNGGGGDGYSPTALIQGINGNFYGTTAGGGAAGAGTLFMITPSAVETVLYSFTGGFNTGRTDGYSPNAVIQGSGGDFYGTTACGGANQAGTVFKINAAGEETGLYSFNGGKTCQFYP
jgi:uncharacterized repeat protein (TIGR03803 family)